VVVAFVVVRLVKNPVREEKMLAKKLDEVAEPRTVLPDTVRAVAEAVASTV
jgi:hypothetical protein